VEFFDTQHEISNSQLESFLGDRLHEAGVWESPRSSDGISALREIERTSVRARLCGQIWEIVEQSLHAFWLDVERSADDVRWTLYFGAIVDSPRRARNAAYALSDPGEVEWNVTLSGSFKAGFDG
jgi:hypothetical protein